MTTLFHLPTCSYQSLERNKWGHNLGLHLPRLWKIPPPLLVKSRWCDHGIGPTDILYCPEITYSNFLLTLSFLTSSSSPTAISRTLRTKFAVSSLKTFLANSCSRWAWPNTCGQGRVGVSRYKMCVHGRCWAARSEGEQILEEDIMTFIIYTMTWKSTIKIAAIAAMSWRTKMTTGMKW